MREGRCHHAPLQRRAFGFRLGLCIPPLHVSNIRFTVLQSPAPGRHIKISQVFLGGIDFVARVTCYCSVHVPAGVAFYFPCWWRLQPPRLWQNTAHPVPHSAGGREVSNFSLLLHLKDSPFPSRITLAPLGRFSSIKLSLHCWKN